MQNVCACMCIRTTKIHIQWCVEISVSCDVKQYKLTVDRLFTQGREKLEEKISASPTLLLQHR